MHLLTSFFWFFSFVGFSFAFFSGGEELNLDKLAPLPIEESIEKDKPKIRLHKSYFNIQEIAPDSNFHTWVRYSNYGTEPLIVTQIFSEDKGLKFEFPKHPLMPNKTDSFLIKLVPGLDHRVHREYIRVVSNAGEKHISFNYEIAISGSALHVRNDFARLKTLYPGTHRNVPFFLTNRGDSNLIISAVKSSWPGAVPGWQEKTLQPKESTVLWVRCSVGQMSGTHKKQLTIYSNDSLQSYRHLILGFDVEPIPEKGPLIFFENPYNIKAPIAQGERCVFEFPFTNIGTEALIISNVKGSCGCLVPTWPKEPILPGESGMIIGTYDSKRIGPINKSLTLTCNSVIDPTQIIRIAGDVIPKPEQPKTLPSEVR